MFQSIIGRSASSAFLRSKQTIACLLIAVAGFFTSANALQAAQPYSGGRNTRALVVESINEGKLVTLSGNTHPAARAENDRGAVSDNLPMDHMQLQLQRPAELEQELVNLMDEQQRKGSAQYHHWLTAQEFGDRFGVSRQDIETVSNWLQNHGFRVDGVPISGMVIEFSGTAGQVKQAFHTEIHNVEVDGVAHIANMSDPQIPAALTGVVKGVHALHNFMPHSMVKKRPQFTFDCPAANCGSDTTLYAVGPQDLATIYNLNPAFAAGYTGAGQTIVVIEDTNILNASDVATFRSAFGLSGYSGTFSQVNPTGSATCNNPGANGDEGEAALDAEWAGASAPDANVVLASCADTNTVFGGLVALQNLINGANPPQIVSISYGECESENGNAANASYVTTYQQAAALGVSVFVSSGDEGAASCDADKTVATHGIAVSGFTSTPYNVSVGGTDFGDVYLNAAESGPALSTYWGGDSSNTSGLGSALSYIPEIPWNDSCASQLIYSLPLLAQGSYTQSYGSSGFCNSTIGKADYRTTGSGSGGPSLYEGVGTLYPSGNKPSWQSVLGNPSDNTRDIPDVSLFAANGAFNHFLVYCLTDAAQGGVPCDYTNVADTLDSAAGGTSFSSPIMAGIQALINQSTGGFPLGNPDYQLYALANAEYGTTGNAACNSSLGTGEASGCIFNDVTLGDIDVNCRGTATSSENCYGYTGTTSTAVQGALSTSTSALSIAYGTNSGWDFATGLGSVNVYNLIKNWNGIPTTTVITSSLSPSVSGGSVTFTATVTPSFGNTVTGTVEFAPFHIGDGCYESVEISAGTASCTTTSLPVGSTTIAATYYPANTGFAGSIGTFTQTVNPALAITSAAGATFTAGTAGSFTVTTTGTPTPALNETGALPSGVSFVDNGNGTATIGGTPAVSASPSYPITITASNGTVNATQNFTLTVVQNPATLISPTPGISTVLGTTNVTFQWTTGTGVTEYQLNLGTTAGASNVFLYKGTATSAIAAALPANDVTVYATLYSKINGVWQSNAYLYTESGTPTPAVLTSPTPGLSTILGTSNVAFQWTAGGAVSNYQLNLSAITPGASDLFLYKGTATSAVVPSLPAHGVTVYATLYSKVNGTWQSNSYVYTESGSPTPAALTSPTPGLSTILGTTSVLFQWAAGTSASDYQLNLSATTPGASDLFSYKGTALSATVPALPAHGVTVYATLYSKIDGVWLSNAYVYTESGAPTPAALTSPTPGISTILGTSNVLFQWSAGTSASEYQLNLSAVAPGGTDLYVYKGTALSTSAPSLPANGATIYARMYSKIDGNWLYNDYVYTEQ
jgi:hypothetical protein